MTVASDWSSFRPTTLKNGDKATPHVLFLGLAMRSVEGFHLLYCIVLRSRQDQHAENVFLAHFQAIEFSIRCHIERG